MRTIVFYVKHLSMLRAWVDPVAPFVADSGLDIVVLHASRLNTDTSQSAMPESCPYRTIELSGMSMRAITDTIRELEPVAILMFTFRSLFDLLLARAARRCGVNTVYVQHGFYVSTRFTLADKRTSIRRYLRFVSWYLSFLAGVGVRRMWRELAIVWRAMVRIDYGASCFDYGLFYAPAGLEDAARFFDFADGRTFFSGYPIAASTADLERTIRASRSAAKRAIYVHQPFILDKFTHIDHEGEFAFLVRMGDVCSRHGYEFVLKIHPRESVERYERALEQTSVSIDTSSSIVEALANCEVVIGQFSTALFIGVLLEKPIVAMNYPGLADEYYAFFAPVAMRARSVDDLDGLLGDPSRLRQRLDRFAGFADEYIGRNNSYQHQAETILAIVRHAQGEPVVSRGGE